MKTNQDLILEDLRWRPMNPSTIIIYAVHHKHTSPPNIVNCIIRELLNASGFDLQKQTNEQTQRTRIVSQSYKPLFKKENSENSQQHQTPSDSPLPTSSTAPPDPPYPTQPPHPPRQSRAQYAFWAPRSQRSRRALRRLGGGVGRG